MNLIIPNRAKRNSAVKYQVYLCSSIINLFSLRNPLCIEEDFLAVKWINYD